jgi:hypothetical protein
VTTGEDQAEAVVRPALDRLGLGVAEAQRLEALELGSLGLEVTLAADPVDSPVARHASDPGARVGRDAVAWPALERDHERLLDRLLGRVEVAQNADQGRDRAPGLVPEDARRDQIGFAYADASAVAVESSEPYCS